MKMKKVLYVFVTLLAFMSAVTMIDARRGGGRGWSGGRGRGWSSGRSWGGRGWGGRGWGWRRPYVGLGLGSYYSYPYSSYYYGSPGIGFSFGF